MSRCKGCKGSATIEMAYLMPLFFSVFIVIVYMVFYFHDKNILYGAAYETAVMGTQVIWMEEKKPDVLEAYLGKRIGKKLLLFREAEGTVEVNKEEVVARAKVSKGVMRLSVEVRADITEPEKKIREIRHMKELVTRGEKGENRVQEKP